MLYESPTANTATAAAATENDPDGDYYSSLVFKFHDYPKSVGPCKAVLGPCRYSLMNGNVYPSYLHGGQPPAGLVNHWQATVPGFVPPTFCSSLTTPHGGSHNKNYKSSTDENDLEEDQTQEQQPPPLVYAYLPMEHVQSHLNDPNVHYHLAGKDAIPLMTEHTTKLYTNTTDVRPCIVKTTHSMGSKGIFVIQNDKDEAEFQAFLEQTGNPTYIITEFIDICRNVACHFFIHPDGTITWFGSNENYFQNGGWSTDSYINRNDQDELRDLQLPFVYDVARYCLSLGFWGSCGIDVLFDAAGQGYLVDVNPRTTGSCPAIMVSHLLQQQNATQDLQFCVFRRSTEDHAFPGSARELLLQVQDFNDRHVGEFVVVIYSFFEEETTTTATKSDEGAEQDESSSRTANRPSAHSSHPTDTTTATIQTLINIGVHGKTSMADCEAILNSFAQPRRCRRA